MLLWVLKKYMCKSGFKSWPHGSKQCWAPFCQVGQGCLHRLRVWPVKLIQSGWLWVGAFGLISQRSQRTLPWVKVSDMWPEIKISKLYQQNNWMITISCVVWFQELATWKQAMLGQGCLHSPFCTAGPSFKLPTKLSNQMDAAADSSIHCSSKLWSMFLEG